MSPIYFDDANLLPPEEGAPSPVFWHQWDLDRLESFISRIITARAIGEPGCFRPEELQMWGVYAPESHDLDEALQNASRLYEAHIDHLLSDPERHPPEFGLLMREFLHTLLTDLVDQLRSGQKVNWESALRWNLLAEIRDGIDTLSGQQIGVGDSSHDELKAEFEELKATFAELIKEEPDEDGPIAPSSFRWKGRTAKLTPKPWALVNFLWKQCSREQDGETVRCSDFFTVAREVWDKEDVALGRAINSTASRATGEFETAAVPIRLSVSKPDDNHHYVTLVISDTDA